ncbi:NAD(P)H-hydrate dehydratase [Candidatus Marinamargulisbacteria bacterium SCGC AG-410-N11]|nr:NAD(P)H-hydrate dehydratase [Candidatus Marinamargulisbacteria bacterium SCGC AG-410-N11]
MALSTYNIDKHNLIPNRNNLTHKGRCGKLAILAGSLSMIGAAILAAKAAYRSGVGIVYLFTIDTAVPMLNMMYPEVVVFSLKSKNGFVSDIALDEILSKLNTLNINALVIGPGLGINQEVKSLVTQLLTKIEKKIPIIIDADGLKVLNINDVVNCSNIILTPHPKEFDILFKTNVAKVKNYDEDRLNIIKSIVKNLNCVIILKGFHTLVANNLYCYQNRTGNSGMATAGSGDVLSGVLGSFVAQRNDLYHNAVSSVYIHGLAGDASYQEKGIGLIASDIVDSLPKAIKNINNQSVL